MATPTTLPASFTAGQVLTALQLNNLRGAFRVLQVVGATSSTNVSTTSSTYVTSGLSASITPSSTSSKILIIASTPGNVSASNEAGNCTIFRGTVAGTNLATGSAAYMTRILTGAYGAFVPIFLDSPNTTSATTYTVGLRSGHTDTTTRAQAFDGTGSIVLMEISA